MKGKVLLLLLMVGVLSVPRVIAEQPWDTIKDIITLDFFNNIGISSTGDSVEGFIRLLILITLFALFFSASEKFLKFGKNISVVIALTISLISTILIPGTLLLGIATTYSTIVYFILLGLPVFVGLWAYFTLTEHPWIRIGILIPLIYGVHLMIGFLGEGHASGFFTFGATIFTLVFFTLVLIVMYILLGLCMLKIFNVGAHISSAPGWIKETLSKKKEEQEDAAKVHTRRELLEPTKGFIVNVMDAIDKLDEALDDKSVTGFRHADDAYDEIIKNLRNARREIATARRRGDAIGEKREYLLKLGAYAQDEERYAKKEIKGNFPNNYTDPDWDTSVATVQVALRELKGRCGYVLSSIDQFLEEDAIEFVSPHGRAGARS